MNKTPNLEKKKKLPSVSKNTYDQQDTLSVAGWTPCQRLSVDELQDVPGDIENWLPVLLQDSLNKQPAWKRE